MTPKAQKPHSDPNERDSSPELGSPSLIPQYNEQTGRPIRRNAGQKRNDDAYVDSIIIEEEGEPIELPSEDDDGHIVKAARPKKRKRTPSPTPPPLDPIIYNEEPDEMTDSESEGIFHHIPTRTPLVTLQFNIPLGFHGPLRVKLDKSLLDSSDGSAHDMQPPRVKSKSNTPKPAPKAKSSTKPKGFADLPPELRNKVYRMLFIAHWDLKFHIPNNFCRSAQFLRSCKLVHSEGCSVLYGENQFVFDRNRHTRAPFWEPQPKEIGYKDVRQFLKMIGPENLAYLRDVKFVFEDAMPAATPYLPSHEARRFINDDHLIDCLRILREAKLRKLTLSFNGRRMLLKSDMKFLGYLEQIKVDELSCTDFYHHWYPANKVHPGVTKDLKEAMIRKKKLYAEE